MEAELSQTNANALDNAVLSLLEDERMKQSSRYRSTLFRWGIALTLALLIVFTWWVHRSRRHKKHLLQKESEIEELQKKVSDATKEVIELAKNNDDSFLVRFDELNPQFSRNLYRIHPDIIQSEFAFAC